MLFRLSTTYHIIHINGMSIWDKIFPGIFPEQPTPLSNFRHQ